MVSLVALVALTQAQQSDPYEPLAKQLRTLVGKWETVEKGALHDIKGTWDVRPALDDALILEYRSAENRSLLVFGLYGDKDSKGVITPHVVIHVTNGAATFTDFYGDWKGDTITASTKDKRQQMSLQWSGDSATWVRSLLEKGKAKPFISVTATRSKG